MEILVTSQSAFSVAIKSSELRHFTNINDPSCSFSDPWNKREPKTEIALASLCLYNVIKTGTLNCTTIYLLDVLDRQIKYMIILRKVIASKFILFRMNKAFQSSFQPNFGKLTQDKTEENQAFRSNTSQYNRFKKASVTDKNETFMKIWYNRYQYFETSGCFQHKGSENIRFSCSLVGDQHLIYQ